jgi:Phosphotransferase enzyme family
MPFESELGERLQALCGAAPVRARRVERGYTRARRLVVELEDGRSLFVKLATNANTVAWLRAERRVYESLVLAPFLPRMVAFDDALGPPLLVLEDLSHAYWPPPWRAGDVEAVQATLAEVASAAPPDGLPLLEGQRATLDGWPEVARDPQPFLSLGLGGARWLEQALPLLSEASATAPLAGESLVHLDVRSDNLCRTADRALLIDWNHACIGNAAIDAVSLAPSLHSEGGPPPDAFAPGQPGLAALIAGYFASRAGLPDTAAARDVRPLQRRQLEVALPWACRELGLPPPV